MENDTSPVTRRGPLWPQTFGSQMDNIGGDVDLTEPLLRSDDGNDAASNGEPRSGSSPVGRNEGSGGLTKDSEWTHFAANGVEEGACDTQEDVVPSGSSSLQAAVNGINVLVGVGILSTPCALSQGGWLSMSFLLGFAVICFYTGILLRRCLEMDPAVLSFPDIGQAAFGRKGRLVVSLILYFELYCVTVEFLILEGDNLASLFPFNNSIIGTTRFTPQQVYIMISALCMLPTVLLRDLSRLSYISAFGAVASIAFVTTVGYVGEFEGVGFHHRGTLFNVSGLPVAMGVYAFCFCGHAVFPSIYRSMKHKQDFTKVLLVCFALVSVIYAGIGILGYTMFGDEVESQVTLNLPSTLLSSKIAIWITLVSPFAKYALTLLPVAVALEELLPWTPKSRQFIWCSSSIRIMLTASTMIIAVAVPFFAYMMAFIGSFLSISVAVILPCLCYLRVFGRQGRVSTTEYAVVLVILLVGLLTAFIGTYSALKGIIGSFDGHAKVNIWT